MSTDDTGPAAVAALVTELATASAGTAQDLRRLADLLVGRLGAVSARLDAGLELALLDAVDGLWGRGWAPRDVAELVRRRLGPTAVGPALDAVAADARRRPRGWSEELAGLGGGAPRDDARSLPEQWRTERGLGAVEAVRTGLALVGALSRLPVLPRVAEPEPSVEGVDAKVLARVRALLAKAESTEFAEEAEALSAKAQELMARHALEQALVDAGTGRAASAASRRIWLDAPYVSAKSSLVHQVAAANRCRAVSLDALDLVTVVGHVTDLATVELLVTSLLVQAGRAMLAERSGPGGLRGDGSRTRSFRHAFLLAYATRIGERLREADDEARRQTEDDAPVDADADAPDGVGSGALLPVLAARQEVVDRTVEELFPRLTTRRFSVGNAAGWRAGRAAADAASLTPGRERLSRSAGG